MLRCFPTILLAGLFLPLSIPMTGQEVLLPAKVQVKASRKHLPSLGLPIRTDGGIDAIVKYREECWEGADSAQSIPCWTMRGMKPDSPSVPEHLGAILELCRKWAAEKPKGTADIVYGPFKGGWFIAVCKKTRSSLGWKSIAFVIPPEGIVEGKRIYDYSHSVNWLEHQIGYNLYPKLPGHIQEIIEEMTAAELLCPVQEFDQAMDERPDQEIDYDWEADSREM